MTTSDDKLKARFLELFHYDPATGILFRRVSRGNTVKGSVCKTKSSEGYYRVLVDGKRYTVHQVVFCIVYGFIPACIDHVNGDKADNRMSNLRSVTFQENIANQTKAKNTNKLGILGVHALPSGKYRAQRMVKGRKYWSTPLDTLEQAANEYKALKEKHG